MADRLADDVFPIGVQCSGSMLRLEGVKGNGKSGCR